MLCRYSCILTGTDSVLEMKIACGDDTSGFIAGDVTVARTWGRALGTDIDRKVYKHPVRTAQ